MAQEDSGRSTSAGEAKPATISWAPWTDLSFATVEERKGLTRAKVEPALAKLAATTTLAGGQPGKLRARPYSVIHGGGSDGVWAAIGLPGGRSSLRSKDVGADGLVEFSADCVHLTVGTQYGDGRLTPGCLLLGVCWWGPDHLEVIGVDAYSGFREADLIAARLALEVIRLCNRVEIPVEMVNVNEPPEDVDWRSSTEDNPAWDVCVVTGVGPAALHRSGGEIESQLREQTLAGVSLELLPAPEWERRR